MRTRVIALGIALGIARTAYTAPTPPGISDSALRASATRAIALIDRSVASWHQQRTCFSCHHQALPIAAVALARSRGIPVDETLARKNISAGLLALKSLDRNVQGYQQIDPSMEIGTELLAGSIAGIPPGIAQAAAAHVLAGWQLADGHWTTLDLRPPQSYSPISATANTIRGIQVYWPAGHEAELSEHTARARAWLLKVVPRNTTDLASRLRGLRWTDATAADVARAADALRAEQRADGGWGQLRSRPSDAYATGEALLALHEAGGLPVSDAAYQRGVRYLLDHQEPDGSWRVETRMHEQELVSPPHFEIGFPHGEHQMISCMGTTLAVTALMQALPSTGTVPSSLVDQAEWRMVDEAPWMATALFGTRDALRSQLDAGLAPNAATAEGTSLLMLASSDADKVQLLLDRGADVNRPANTGFTPLMVALNRRDAARVALLLLDHGANPKPSDPKPVHGASPLFYAVWSGNLEVTRVLLSRGADARQAMKLGGQGAITPFDMAVFQGDHAIVRQLASAGLDLNTFDDFGVSLLDSAVLGNDIGMARTLLGLGAKVDLVDELSFTPLMHASSVYFGDTGMVELLVASGADRALKSKDGLTALDLARKYGHAEIVRILEATHPSN